MDPRFNSSPNENDKIKLNKRLGEYLFSLDSPGLKLDEVKIEELLKAGADPNYQNEHGRHILYEALNECNLPVLKLALKYGADPNLHTIQPGLIYDRSKKIEIFTYAVKNRLTMLQEAIHVYKRACSEGNLEKRAIAYACYQALEEKFEIQEPFKISDNDLLKLYIDLYDKISSEKEKLEPNKFLLITIGESHPSVLSLLVEIFVLLISKELKINSVLVETNLAHLKAGLQEKGNFSKYGWTTSVEFEPFSLKKGFNVIPVDLGLYGAKKIGPAFNDYEDIDVSSNFERYRDSTTPEMMQYRDNVMHSVITEGFHDNGILILGGAHVSNVKAKPFPHHSLLCINSTIIEEDDVVDHSYGAEESRKFEKDPSIFNPDKSKLIGLDYLYHPKKVISEAIRIHEIFTAKKTIKSDARFFTSPKTTTTPVNTEKDLEKSKNFNG